MSEFETAIAASRMTAPVVKNFSDAPAGSLGMKSMPVQTSANFGEFASAVGNTRAGEACPTKMYPMASGGNLGGAGSHGSMVDPQSYEPANYFANGASAQGSRLRGEGPDGGLGTAPNGNLPKTPGGGL
jgi:hypothetical protein